MLLIMEHRGAQQDLACELPPFGGAQHLDALRRNVVAGIGAPRLDLEGYAAELVASLDVGLARWDAILPRVLRRVARLDLRGPTDDGSWVELSCGTRVRLGDCPFADRVQAAREALREDGEDERDAVRVAERLLDQVLELAESPVALRQLSASSVVELATAVLDRYDQVEAPGALDDYDELDPEELPGEEVRMVLALHRSLSRARLPPPHTPPRNERPKPRWPPQSLPPQVPLLIAPAATAATAAEPSSSRRATWADPPSSDRSR